MRCTGAVLAPLFGQPVVKRKQPIPKVRDGPRVDGALQDEHDRNRQGAAPRVALAAAVDVLPRPQRYEKKGRKEHGEPRHSGPTTQGHFTCNPLEAVATGAAVVGSGRKTTTPATMAAPTTTAPATTQSHGGAVRSGSSLT